MGLKHFWLKPRWSKVLFFPSALSLFLVYFLENFSFHLQ